MMRAAANSLRVGVFRDRPVFEESQSDYDSLIVPAHLAAYSVDGLWGFLSGVADAKEAGTLSFTIDPMTYWLDLPPVYWLRGSERGRGPNISLPVRPDQIRPAFAALLDAYGLLDRVSTVGSPDELARSLDVGSCLEFQRRGIAARSRKAVSKYADILGIDLDADQHFPDRLMAPYLGIGPGAIELSALQVRWNAEALSDRRQGESLWACLALTDEAERRPLSQRGAAQLNLSAFDGTALWVGGLDEYEASSDALRRYRELIRSIPTPVWLMYAGYYGLLCLDDGVSEISHGVYYTENKQLAGPVGSGPPAERYYIPALHRFYEPIRAFGIIDLLPQLACPCPECGGVDALRAEAIRAPTAPSLRMAWIQRLQRHFLHARRAETAAARASSRSELVAGLVETVRLTEGLSPRAKAGARLDVGHLQRWIGSFD
jgi:hypothetical protein